MTPYDIILKPVVSEKGYSGIVDKKYTFIVAKQATKFDIKNAVEVIFGVKVAKVNVANYDGKVKRMGRTEGSRPAYKKAYVKLTAESKPIEFFESLS